MRLFNFNILGLEFIKQKKKKIINVYLYKKFVFPDKKNLQY